MKKQVILIAQTLGYFRSKKEDVKSGIVTEMLELEELEGTTIEAINEILEAETLRRHVVYQTRQAKSVEKAIADSEKPLTGGVDSADAHVEEYASGRYVLTTAQNNTDVDKVFFSALLKYCEVNGARLLIAKTTYNKNGFQQSQDATEGVYYDPLVVPYLVDSHISIGSADFIGNANVLPTAKNPLSGFEGVTKTGIHVIIPATKIALKCTAALKGGASKLLFSTGTCTKRNYMQRKAGTVAASDHNIGALFVDTTGEGFVARQLECMPNSAGFYDEGAFYTGHSVEENQRPSVLQFGDIHAEKMEEVNLNIMLALLTKYSPHHIMLHDVMDFSSRNHHNVKDCAFMFAQSRNTNTVAGDIKKVVQVIDELYTASSLDSNIHIVESNHDLAINTWLKNEDFKKDPANALTYLQCMCALYTHIDRTGNTDFNMLEYVCYNVANMQATGVIFHGTDESVVIAGVEHGCHGHTGVNGSRGSPAQFRSLGVAMNTGHTHTPSIMGGCYTAGVTGSLEMGYNIGASSWQLANVLTWPNGQRQVIFM